MLSLVFIGKALNDSDATSFLTVRERGGILAGASDDMSLYSQYVPRWQVGVPSD